MHLDYIVWKYHVPDIVLDIIILYHFVNHSFSAMLREINSKDLILAL